MMNLFKKDMLPQTIGVVLGNFEEACQSEILSGITAYLKQHHIHLTIFVGTTFLEASTPSKGHATVLADLISSAQVDGLLLMGGAMSNFLSSDELTHFVQHFSHLPMLSISSPIPGIPSLLIDNYSGIADIISHLIHQHGCQTIAFIGGPADHTEAIYRLEAYQETLTANHISINPQLIVTGEFSRQSGEEAIRILLDERGLTHIDAFVCADDATACGALHAIKMRGYSIPNDFYVTGFDDIEEMRNAIPQLTTVRQPFYEMGECGARMLLEALYGTEIPRYTYYPTQMVVRESCGCLSHTFTSDLLTCNQAFLPLPFSTLEANVAHFLKSVSVDLESTQLESTTIVSFIETLIYRIIYLEDIESTDFWCYLRNMIYNCLDHRISLTFWEKLLTFTHEIYLTYSPMREDVYLIKYFFARLHSLLRDIKRCHDQYLHTEQALHLIHLRTISQKLIASFDMDTLFTTLSCELPHLGITTCYIGIYPHVLPQNYTFPDTDPSHMVLVFSYMNGQRLIHTEKHAFSYQQLTNTTPDTQGTYLFMPLLFRNNYLGYILFNYTKEISPNVYQILRSHISSGLKGAFLYQNQQELEA